MSSSTKSSSSDKSNSSALYDRESSALYERESFTEIRPKILAVAGARIWPRSHAGNINVEHLRGGSFNRIFGLTLTHDQNVGQVAVDDQTLEAGSPQAPVDYILRVPRFNSSHVDADVAVTLFVQRLPMVKNQDIEIPQIPVPKIILFDDSENNEIKKPFMVQNRLRGQNLRHIYNQLGHEQQRRVAQDLGLAYRRMLAVYSTQAGMLVLPDDNKTLDAEIHVRASEPYAKLLSSDKPPRIRGSSPYRAGRADESVYEFLTRTFEEQKAQVERAGGIPEAARIDEFLSITSEMVAHDFFKSFDGHFALAHLDLFPRNILVDLDSPSDGPIVSGILDWDNAVLAPAFMTCRPPFWIWNWELYLDEGDSERFKHEEPASARQKDLKEAFETAAGPLYVEAAYHPAYLLARELVRLAIFGMADKRDRTIASNMLRVWKTVLRENA